MNAQADLPSCVQRRRRWKTGPFFCAVFSLFLSAGSPYFLAYFPGILSNDSVWQMDQILGIRPLSNHHPFTHTMIIKLFYSIGYAIFWHGKRWNRHLYVIPDDNDGPHLLLPDSYGLPPKGQKQAGASGCWPILRWFLSMRCTA